METVLSELSLLNQKTTALQTDMATIKNLDHFASSQTPPPPPMPEEHQNPSSHQPRNIPNMKQTKSRHVQTTDPPPSNSPRPIRPLFPPPRPLFPPPCPWQGGTFPKGPVCQMPSRARIERPQHFSWQRNTRQGKPSRSSSTHTRAQTRTPSPLITEIQAGFSAAPPFSRASQSDPPSSSSLNF